MAGTKEKVADQPLKPVQRLCNEIQLFDLCDLEKCRYKAGLFCTNEDLLQRFEAIAEVEDRPVEGFISDENGDEEEPDSDGYDDAFDDDYDTDGYEEDE